MRSDLIALEEGQGSIMTFNPVHFFLLQFNESDSKNQVLNFIVEAGFFFF